MQWSRLNPGRQFYWDDPFWKVRETEQVRFYPQSLHIYNFFSATLFYNLLMLQQNCVLNNRQIMTSFKVATVNSASLFGINRRRAGKLAWAVTQLPCSVASSLPPFRDCSYRKPKGAGISAVTCSMFYLWYVMEKARLFLVREKRALATPLELGSHESVTPVSTATKSAGGERRAC